MEEDTNKDLEKSFSDRNETLQSFYNTAALELSAEELSSLTPILNSLKDHISRYEEIEKIAEGGEKKITLAYDHRLDRQVAMARAVRNKAPQDLEQFLREARLTANLAHPNIMPVYNMGLDGDGEPFFSMELIPGDSLKSIIKKIRDHDGTCRRDYTLDVLLNIYQKVCDAIAYAHSRGVLHLDIKPDNIRVGKFGEVLVCDWGLARVINEDVEQVSEEADLLDGDILNDMTLSGTMKGTPGFMAPEQTQAYGEKTSQTDVYALGALLYMLMTYKLPVAGKSANEVIQNTRDGKIVSIRRRRTDHKVPNSLIAVAMKALSLKPEDRYATVIELKRDVSLFLSGYPTNAEHAGLVSQGSLLLRRHYRITFLLIFFLLILAFVFSANLLAISREKSVAVAAQQEAENNFQLYLKEQQLAQSLNEDLGEAVSFTVRSRDFVNAPSMINLLETGLNENIDTVKKQNLYEQKGLLHFVLQEFNAANECFDTAGKTKRIGALRELSKKYSKIKSNDLKRLSDLQLSELFNESRTANQITLYYLYYHHMRRRPASATPEQYVPLAGAVLDKLNYTRRSRKNPLKLTKSDKGYHLNLSNSNYTLYSISIVGVYRRNVLGPFGLTSLDISGTKLDSLSPLRGLQLEELRMKDVKMSSPKLVPRQVIGLKLKRIYLTVADYPKETLEELYAKMKVFDAETKKKFTPTPRAGVEPPVSVVP